MARSVRTTAAVATEPLLPPDDEAVASWLPLADAAATPPATAPPTRTPARAATATTRLAENSATGDHAGLGARPAVAARAALRS